MNKNYGKIRSIQEANKRLEERLISEGLKSVISEAVLPIIQQGDDLCDILCGKKQAKFGSNGDVVKQIQNALANCGFNTDKQGGGMIEGCKNDYTKCDGKFREETKAAVIEFQKANGLTPDGSVGYNTLKKMGEKCIQLPKCDCNENDNANSDDKGKDWWNLIDGGNSSMNDCDTINKCLYYAISYGKNEQFSNMFFGCMRKKGNVQSDVKPIKGDKIFKGDDVDITNPQIRKDKYFNGKDNPRGIDMSSRFTFDV